MYRFSDAEPAVKKTDTLRLHQQSLWVSVFFYKKTALL